MSAATSNRRKEQADRLSRARRRRLVAASTELLDLAHSARDYLSGIPETAAGGDDGAVALTRALTAVLARVNGTA